MMKTQIKALMDFLSKAVPTDLRQEKADIFSPENYPPPNGGRTRVLTLSRPEYRKSVVFAAEKIYVALLTGYGWRATRGLKDALAQSFDIAEYMIAKRMTWLADADGTDQFVPFQAEKIFLGLINGHGMGDHHHFIRRLDEAYEIAEFMHAKRNAYLSNNDEGAK